MPTQAVLVTGAAGFIGFHVAQRLLAQGREVVGVDSVNNYYDPALKEARLRLLKETGRKAGSAYRFIRADLADRSAVEACFAAGGFDRVIHLAAQAGVQHSIGNPYDYVQSNLVGFTNILEACRHSRGRRASAALLGMCAGMLRLVLGRAKPNN